MEITAAVRDGLDRVSKQCRIVVLGDVALGACLERWCSDGWMVGHAEHDKPRFGLVLEDASHKLEPRISWQIDVDNPDIRFLVTKAAKPAAPSSASMTSMSGSP